VDLVEPAAPVILSVTPRVITLGSPFQVNVDNMPNSTTASDNNGGSEISVRIGIEYGHTE